MPHRNWPIAVLAGLLAMAAAGLAAAQDDGVRRMFDRMDLDGDGFLDPDELAALRARVFNSMDGDRDGTLNRAEYVDLWIDSVTDEGDPRRNDLRRLREERFADLDGDGDGAVTKEEYVATGQRRFLAADRDGDGRLDFEEFVLDAEI